MRLIFLLIIVLAASCVAQPTLRLDSPEGVEKGSRTYPHPPTRVQAATTKALATLGFRVTKAEGGRVRTAPKTLVVHAVGGGGRALAVESSVAWDIRLTTGVNGTLVHAVPRGYSGGQEWPPSAPWDAETLDGLYATLFRELDDELGPANPRQPRSN